MNRSLSLPFSVAATLSSLALAVTAQAAPARIQFIDAAPGAAAVIEVTGEWSSGCPPLLREVATKGRELTLTAQPDSTRCSGMPGPYRLLAELPDTLKAAANGEVWRLRYQLRDDPVAPPRLMAFELLQVGDATAVDPETGFWWSEAGGEFDHAGPGLGAQLEIQNDVLALAFSGYSESGAPEWMFGAAPLGGRVSDLPLNSFQGGRGPFGGYVGPTDATPMGRLQIEWLGAARAVFWFSRDDAQQRGIELQSVSMVRFDFGREPGKGWAGRWLLESGEQRSPQIVELVDLVERAPDFALLGPAGEAMQCQRSATRPSSPPVLCELQLADGSILRFDDVGLARMQGTDERGNRVRASLLAR